jgi:EAL domain-containing protein (putative c-di-GMP-specific phosphodiesterase class I)
MLANAPISAGDRVVGMMSLGTTDEGNQAIYEERLASSREFGVVAGALLAAALEARASEREDHAALTRLIAEEAFHPVFQPIVDLGSRKTVGFEALTRFADGVRPDVRFEAADRVGLGTELEWATLDAATRDADALPEGAYLSLNVSPAVVADVERVVGLVARGPRPVVLEVTEHAAVANYATLCEALVTLRGFARIAVDDVGAGYAGLRHILEIRPDILKLDIGLVRAVDEDAAKRALIGSIVAFSRETGSVVLAEGIETDAESQTLLALGVELGQGYLFGRPERVTTVR